MIRVLVLLSTFNGEKYLPELLESVEKQKAVKVNILARDDGSKDKTISILEDFAKKYHNIQIVKGENLGYAKSFWTLVQEAEGYDYYAFCDQDDVWLEDKMARAVQKMQKIEGPVLYTSAVKAVNDKNEILSDNLFQTTGVQNVYKSFQRSIVPGCVMVFNEAAREKMAKYRGVLESHDWAAYIITRVFGTVIFDKESCIHYRIHSGNTLGANSGGLKQKIKNVFHKKKRIRSRFAKDFWATYEKDIPEVYRQSIYNLGHYRESLLKKMRLFFDRNYRGAIFKLYVLLGWV